MNSCKIYSALVALFVCICEAQAQTNLPAPLAATETNSLVEPVPKPARSDAVRAEQIRAECVAGRRMICGRVLKVLPDGLVVESGYTNLLRKELHGIWLLPGTVVASREPGLVESQQPDSPCVGTVFLTDLPRPRGGAKVKVKPYEYVVLRGYPAGSYTYGSVGGIQRTVRRFSVGLETAVNLRLQHE